MTLPALRRSRLVAFVLLWTAASTAGSVLSIAAMRMFGLSNNWGVAEAALQVAVLWFVAWRWWWGAATVGGALATDLLFSRLWRAGLQPLYPAVVAIAAIPQWLVLRRYGMRATVWLAVTPVARLLHRPLVAVLFPDRRYLDFSTGYPWAQLTAIALVDAILEAAVLAWIMQREFEHAPTPAVVTDPLACEPTPTHTAEDLAALRRRMTVLQLALGAVLALALLASIPPLANAPGRIRPDSIAAIACFMLPYAVALAMLYRPALYHPGAVLAASASIITLVPLVPLMAVATLLSGFMLDNKDQWFSYFMSVGLTITLAGVAVIATRAARRVPPADRRMGSWPVGFVVTLAYAGTSWGLVAGLAQRTVDRGNALAAANGAARQQVTKIASCAAAYAAEHPGSGLPRSLSDMAAGERPCLDPAVASGEAGGFRYEYLPGLPDEQGVVHLFNACAVPLEYRESGTLTTAIDQSGPAEGVAWGADRQTAVSCREEWYRDYPRAIQYCALRYAAAHPALGYPASLKDIGVSGDGCLVIENGTPDGYEHSLESNSTRYTYVADPADASGRVTGFDLHIRIGEGDRAQHRLFNGRGELHVASAQRLATRKDPLWATILERRSSRQGYGRAVVEAACEAGDAAECLEAGDWNRNDGHLDRAIGYYDRACSAGEGTGCWRSGLTLAKDPESSESARAAFERGCRLPDGESCFELGRLASTTAEAEAAFDRACAAGSGRGCVAVARGLPPDRSADAERLLQAGCDAGEPSACSMLGQRLMPTRPDSGKRLMIMGCAMSDRSDPACGPWR